MIVFHFKVTFKIALKLTINLRCFNVSYLQQAASAIVINSLIHIFSIRLN